MFENLVKKYPMENEIKPSKKRIKANCSALRSLIEQEDTMNKKRKSAKIFKKPLALAATITLFVCLTGVTAFAASNGLFTSIKKAFYNDDNALLASEPSEYAFIPDVAPITHDDITVNVTEAIADSHSIRVFMDVIFKNGLPKEIMDDCDYKLIGFEDYGSTPGVITSEGVSVEDNVLSLCIGASGIQESKWGKDGFTIAYKNLECYTYSGEQIIISDISEEITIPVEQIKRNHPLTAHTDIDGVSVNMELSILGINITFDSKEDFDKIENKITHPQSGGLITPSELGFYMKDGTVYGNGKNMDKAMRMFPTGTSGVDTDGKYYYYKSFSIPVDIKNVEKITLNDYEFYFE